VRNCWTISAGAKDVDLAHAWISACLDPKVGRYLTETDGNRLLRDVEQIARNRPWLVAGGGTVLGFLTARFTKASSSRRFEENSAGPSRPALPRPTAAGVGGGGDVGTV
jgi:hypothetical protein